MDNLKTQRPQRPVNATELRRKVSSGEKKEKQRKPLKWVKTPINNLFPAAEGKWVLILRVAEDKDKIDTQMFKLYFGNQERERGGGDLFSRSGKTKASVSWKRIKIF